MLCLHALKVLGALALMSCMRTLALDEAASNIACRCANYKLFGEHVYARYVLIEQPKGVMTVVINAAAFRRRVLPSLVLELEYMPGKRQSASIFVICVTDLPNISTLKAGWVLYYTSGRGGVRPISGMSSLRLWCSAMSKNTSLERFIELNFNSDNVISSPPVYLNVSRRRNNVLLDLYEDTLHRSLYYEYDDGDFFSASCWTQTLEPEGPNSLYTYHLDFNGTVSKGRKIIEKSIMLRAADDWSMLECSLCGSHCEDYVYRQIRVLFRLRQETATITSPSPRIPDRSKHSEETGEASGVFNWQLIGWLAGVLVLLCAIPIILCLCRRTSRAHDDQKPYDGGRPRLVEPVPETSDVYHEPQPFDYDYDYVYAAHHHQRTTCHCDLTHTRAIQTTGRIH